MNIDEIMKMISLKDTGYAHNDQEMRLAIERYAKDAQEVMRQAYFDASPPMSVTADEIMRLAFNYAVAFDNHGRNQEDDSLLTRQNSAEKTLFAAIEQYAKAERESMRQACMKACEGGRVSELEEIVVSVYNEAIDDAQKAILEIK